MMSGIVSTSLSLSSPPPLSDLVPYSLSISLSLPPAPPILSSPREASFMSGKFYFSLSLAWSLLLHLSPLDVAVNKSPLLPWPLLVLIIYTYTHIHTQTHTHIHIYRPSLRSPPLPCPPLPCLSYFECPSYSCRDHAPRPLR